MVLADRQAHPRSLSRLLPGRYATPLLADLGADAIKVEDPVGGDPLRVAPHLFDALNRNKRCLGLSFGSCEKGESPKAERTSSPRTPSCS
ncbi:CoA transferase [Streptomyces sp. NPDC058066]|uniref:CoA transferase n=1 Tax=Streptomyces sp. NPDC058066 TaxID=3346323 RepID=UPI0036EAC583